MTNNPMAAILDMLMHAMLLQDVKVFIELIVPQITQRYYYFE